MQLLHHHSQLLLTIDCVATSQYLHLSLDWDDLLECASHIQSAIDSADTSLIVWLKICCTMLYPQKIDQQKMDQQ